jgi:hypothetical protein
VHLKAAATLVTVSATSRVVTLSPRLDPTDDLWYGYLSDAGLSRGPLDVHRRPSRLWFGTTEVCLRVRVTKVFADGYRVFGASRRLLAPGVWLRHVGCASGGASTASR